MDVYKIKQHIIDNPQLIEQLLESANFVSVKDLGKEYRCGFDETHSPTGTVVNKCNLSSSCYSLNFTGDIITLLQRKLDLIFRETLKWICKELNLEDIDYVKKEVKLPFGGYFKEVKRSFNNEYELQTYDNNILNEYSIIPNERFLKDNISFQTQIKYNIGYDPLMQSITVPWFNDNGELIGIMARKNEDEIEEGLSKWFPIIPFKKSLSIFGYNINYNSIIDNDIVIITESEKGTMQLDSMGLGVGLSLGGNTLSDVNANQIKSLMVTTNILALDESLDIDISIENAKKLKVNNMFMKNNVGIIYDKDNKYLTKGKKFAPTDLGKDILNRLLQECVIWI